MTSSADENNGRPRIPVVDRDVFIHDLKNVMTGALGHLSLARKRAFRDSQVSQSLIAVENILQGACRMAELALSSGENEGLSNEEFSALDLVSVCAGICIPPEKITLRLSYGKNLPMVRGSVLRIKQLFNNILTNTVSALDGQGVVRIHLEREQPDRRLEDPTIIRITISDNGPGVPVELRDKIFTPGFSTRKRGSGLGLASARELLAEMGGEIFLDSEYSEGATFVVRIPGSEEIDIRTLPRASLPSGNEERILVLDDDEMILEIVGELLHHLGWRVVTCNSGEETFQHYCEAKESGDPFQSVILDLNIPEGPGGIKTAEKILDYDPVARLFLSSGQDTPVMNKPNEYGFVGSLKKPYSLEDLSKVLAKV